jgi:hypothetical protein
MKINSAKIISVLLLVTLPFANITRIFGIEDGFSLVTISLLFIFLSINFIYNFRLKFFTNFIGIVFLVLVLAILINLIFNNIKFLDAISNIFKIAVFFLLIDFIKNNDFVINHFLSNYFKVYLLSLIISLPIYYVFPYPEFVFYDGSANRFAGLHFELFNFIFSTSLFFISWVYYGKNPKMGIILTLLLMYFAKSNVFYLYVITFSFIYLFKRFFVNKYFSYISVFAIIFAPIIIGIFLEFLEILNIFTVRKTSSFDHIGSQIYVRLYPYSLAIEHIAESGWRSFFPMGLGYFENTNMVINDPYSFGGTGSPKALVDLGIILFLFLSLYICKIFYYQIRSIKDSHKYSYLILFFSSLIYLSFGAGFFNIVGWFCIFSSSSFWLRFHNLNSK